MRVLVEGHSWALASELVEVHMRVLVEVHSWALAWGLGELHKMVLVVKGEAYNLALA